MIDLLVLLNQCVPANVSVETVRKLIDVESQGDPLALNINTPGQKPKKVHALNVADAMLRIQDALAHGSTVDIGLTQINTRTAPKLGYSIADVLDPCTNIKAGSILLQQNYSSAVVKKGPGQDALKTALSIYNTGDPLRGFTNGYVWQYYPAPFEPKISDALPENADIVGHYQNAALRPAGQPPEPAKPTPPANPAPATDSAPAAKDPPPSPNDAPIGASNWRKKP